MCRGRATSRRHTTFPVLRSRASVINLSPSLAVRKMRFAVTTGEDRANGTDVFQARFFLTPNSAGTSEASAIPAPFGPRNCSHSSPRLTPRWASTDDDNAIAIIKDKRDIFFIFLNRGQSRIVQARPFKNFGSRL